MRYTTAVPEARRLSRWRAAAVRLGKPGLVVGTALDRAAIAGLRRHDDSQAGTSGADEDDAYRRVWEAAAERAGATVVPLQDGFLQAKKGARQAWLWRQETDLDGVTTLRLAADKPAVHRLLAEAGVKVPRHETFDAAEPGRVLRFLEEHGRCAVKPARGTARGSGVTTGVRTANDLDRAVLAAARWDRQVLIEPQFDGPVLRLLFLDGELLDAVARHQPTLTGDGTRAVRELVLAENARRAREEAHLGTSALTVDLDMALALKAQRLDLAAKPAAGRGVVVKGVCNENAAADNSREPAVSAVLIGQARTAAKAVGLRLAGVDVIGDVVLEVNGTPGFLLHERAHGPSANTSPAEAVLRALLG
jgi:D-alanine-D-alanine ligase-like ATP-grasp enzyme